MLIHPHEHSTACVIDLLHASMSNLMHAGAIRMIVLLHAYKSGFTAWDVAIMFSAYELAGVFTNLLAGVAGEQRHARAQARCMAVWMVSYILASGGQQVRCQGPTGVNVPGRTAVERRGTRRPAPEHRWHA